VQHVYREMKISFKSFATEPIVLSNLPSRPCGVMVDATLASRRYWVNKSQQVQKFNKNQKEMALGQTVGCLQTLLTTELKRRSAFTHS